VIDTGFNGFLTLPPARLASLGATWLYRGQAVLADGSVQVFDVYTVTVIWDSQPRRVEAESVDAAPLAGMALLQKHDLKIEIVPGGTVLITPRP
jgi:clan AA aspartic protease